MHADAFETWRRIRTQVALNTATVAVTIRAHVNRSDDQRGDRGGGDSRRDAAGDDVQPPGDASPALPQRVLVDRRAAQAPARPDSQPGRDGEGLHGARAHDA